MSTVDTIAKHIADYAVLVALAGTLAFIAIYGRRPWRTTNEGKALMYRTIALASLLMLNATSIYFPDYWHRQVARALVYVGLAGTVWLLTYVLTRSHNDK